MSPAEVCACVVWEGITAPTTLDAVAPREVAERVVIGDELAPGGAARPPGRRAMPASSARRRRR